VIEVENGEVQFVSWTADDLQRITDAPCREHPSVGTSELFV
jgi:hypothetical protein